LFKSTCLGGSELNDHKLALGLAKDTTGMLVVVYIMEAKDQTNSDAELATLLLRRMSDAYCQTRAVVGSYLVHGYWESSDWGSKSEVGSMSWKEPGRTRYTEVLDWDLLKRMLSGSVRPAHNILKNACRWTEIQPEVGKHYSRILELGVNEELDDDEELFLHLIESSQSIREDFAVAFSDKPLNFAPTEKEVDGDDPWSYLAGSASYTQSIAALGLLISVRNRFPDEMITFRNMIVDLELAGARTDNIPRWDPVGSIPSGWPSIRSGDEHHAVLVKIKDNIGKLAEGRSLGMTDLCQTGHFCVANEVVAGQALRKFAGTNDDVA
jgi:hypothetical protein